LIFAFARRLAGTGLSLVAALLLRRHGLRLIGAQTSRMHGARAGAARAALLTRLARGETAWLIGAAHQRLTRANGTAIEGLARSGRGTRGSAGARRRRLRGARHGTRLLLLQTLNEIGARWNHGPGLRLTG
jgi:hypothetical protein